MAHEGKHAGRRPIRHLRTRAARGAVVMEVSFTNRVVVVLLAATALLSLLCILAMSETRDTALGDAEPGRGPATCPRTFEDTNADR
jgi:hypothetical protein